MSTTAEQILNDALRLSDDERAVLAARLMESLDETYFEVDDSLGADIQRRVEEIRSGVATTVPWEVARRMIVGERDASRSS